MAATRYTGKPCHDCGKKKGPNQADLMRCFTCQKIAKRKSRDNAHDRHIRTTYGLDLKEYRRLLSFQAGKCAICTRATGRSKRLAVDHDHACREGHAPNVGCRECIRGLLCSFCNRAIGRWGDDPRVGERIAHYLTTPPWPTVRDARL